MRRIRSPLLNILLVPLMLGMLVGVTWANYRFTTQFPGGRDFYPQWMATRLLLVRGWSPYGERSADAVARQAPAGTLTDADGETPFRYPVYATLFFSPFSLVGDYPWARALWMTTLEAGMVFITFAGIRIARWRPSRVLLVSLFLFSLSWYHGVRAIIDGSPAIIVACLVAGALLAIRAKIDPLAGFLLALATVKPLMVILLLVFVVLWAISNRRGTLIGVLLGSWAILSAAPMILQPDWILANLGQFLADVQVGDLNTPGAIFREWLPGSGSQLGWVLTGILTLVLLFEWRAAAGKDFNWFFWVVCLTLTITSLIGIRTATANYVVLVPGLLLIFASWNERWPRGGQWLIIAVLVGLLSGLWWVYLKTLGGAELFEDPVMYFPLPMLLIIGLYWIRWWATRPPRVYLDRLRTNTQDLL